MNDVRIRSISSRIHLEEACMTELRNCFLRLEWIAQGCEGGVDDLLSKPFMVSPFHQDTVLAPFSRANIYRAYSR